MSTDRPEPGAELHKGPAATAQPAATVMLLRGGSERLEVLLVQRSLGASFMPGAWVFPGGSVDAQDGDGQTGLRNAARRELDEEAGIALPADAELVAFARWITPVAVTRRFDTWFYVAVAPDQTQAGVDGSEIIDSRWLTPAQALSLEADKQLLLVFPTDAAIGFLSAPRARPYLAVRLGGVAALVLLNLAGFIRQPLLAQGALVALPLAASLLRAAGVLRVTRVVTIRDPRLAWGGWFYR